MAVPASIVPPGNSYTVNVAGSRAALGENGSLEFSGPLSLVAGASAALLRSAKVEVRQHVTGDGPATIKLRNFLELAGCKTSAFSPAPASRPDAPGEGFWKTTLIVVSPDDGDFWWKPRADRKVDWDCLVVAVCDGKDPEDLPAAQIAAADLWILSGTENETSNAIDRWMRLGAGAVAVIAPGECAWASRNAAFGKSNGARPFAAAPGDTGPAWFAAGIVFSLLEELLGENLFEKTVIRVERDILETRPLHLGRACRAGAAALEVAEAGTFPEFLHKKGSFLGSLRARQRETTPSDPALPETSKPWGAKGR